MSRVFIPLQLASLYIMGVLVVSCGGRPTPPPSGSGVLSEVSVEEQVHNLIGPSVVNVFVENSGSMDGYVKGVTEFEQAVYSYISDIKINESVCSAMKLYYINSKKLQQPDNVRDFIEKLEPSSFKLKGGDRKTTDLSNVIGDVITDQLDDEINILVSDCVFSPGRGKNAHEYLINQQIGIKGHFANKLKENPNFAAIIYQLKSDFDGRYFNCFDAPTIIKDKRPFYILIFGERSRLQALVNKVPISKIKGSGVLNSYCIANSNIQPNYGIMVMPKIGSFQPDPLNPRASIKKAKVDKRNPSMPFSLSIGVDFSSLLLEDAYICEAKNYAINNKAYNVSVIGNNTANASYTHIIKLNLNNPIISKGKIVISLKKNKSTWAEQMTDEVGEDIFADGAMEKTFGLKYLVDGIFDAYSDKPTYATLSINIQ